VCISEYGRWLPPEETPELFPFLPGS
jgi:hypothetical protein